MLHCSIQWIDCEGKPTPDNNTAVAILTNKLSKEKYLICEDHLQVLQRGKVHYGENCNHQASDNHANVWDYIYI